MSIRPFHHHHPSISPSAFIASGVYVIGNVTIGDESSIWFGSVLRGDVHSISIGSRTNIQDLTMVHVTDGVASTVVGDDVTVGHRDRKGVG